MKKIILLLALGMLFSIASCSSVKKITDEQILESIKAYDVVKEEGRSFDDLEITSRVLSDDKKTETIESKLNFNSENSKFHGRFRTIWTKDKSEWVLSKTELIDLSYEPIRGLNEQEIFDFGEILYSGLSLGGQTIILDEVDLQNKTAHYKVAVDFQDLYVKETGELEISCQFSYEWDWECGYINYQVTRDWYLDSRTFELKYTTIVPGDSNAVDYSDVSFENTLSETYTFDRRYDLYDELHVKFKNHTWAHWYIYRITDINDPNVNSFTFGFGKTLDNMYKTTLTYDYAKQEFKVVTAAGSIGYLKVK